MKCLMNRKIRFMLLLAVFCSFFLSISFGSSASAVDMWSTGYWQDNCNQSWGLHLFSYLGRYDLPRDAVPYCVGGAGTLEGVRVEQFGSFGDSSKKFNQLTISLTLYQSLNYQGVNTIRTDVPANGYLITTDDIMYKGGCNTHQDREKTVWTCVVNAPDYKSFGYIGIDIGSLYDSADIPIAYYGYDVGFTGSLQYYSLSYNVSSSSDPAVSGINQLVDQNYVIISQNTQMIELLDGNIDAINAQGDAIVNSIDSQQQQQQEQYEAEKEEESERESEQSDSMNELSGVFSFTAFNPFSPILALFSTGDSCVHIPVLASWLNLDNDEVCPMFPVSVRQVLTPIFGMASMMILFGFFVRWLTGNGGDNSLDVGDDNGYFRKG